MACADLVSQISRSLVRFPTITIADPTVLVILDRNIDLIPMLSHSWTYQALVHDVLEMKLNRVSVDVSLQLCRSAIKSLLTQASVVDRVGERQNAEKVIRL